MAHQLDWHGGLSEPTVFLALNITNEVAARRCDGDLDWFALLPRSAQAFQKGAEIRFAFEQSIKPGGFQKHDFDGVSLSLFADMRDGHPALANAHCPFVYRKRARPSSPDDLRAGGQVFVSDQGGVCRGVRRVGGKRGAGVIRGSIRASWLDRVHRNVGIAAAGGVLLGSEPRAQQNRLIEHPGIEHHRDGD